MYIRTKDGRIIDTTKYPEHPASWSVQASDYALTIKQSENLEELCDEIIVEYKDCCEKKTYLYNGTFEDLRKTHRYYYSYKFSPFFKYYGAIWTEKGLIYVAKMNEEGELELI